MEDELSSENLRNSLGKTPGVKIPVPEMRIKTKDQLIEGAKTSRARRISKVLMGDQDLSQSEVAEDQQLNDQARATIAKLVQVFMKNGNTKELEVILHEHIDFANNIIELINRNKG